MKKLSFHFLFGFIFSYWISLGQNMAPEWAVVDQVNRMTIRSKVLPSKIVEVKSESDFVIQGNSENIIFNIKNDIYLTRPLFFNRECNIVVNGNGYSIVGHHSSSIIFSRPMQGDSWKYDSLSQNVVVSLRHKSCWNNISPTDSVVIFYEAWYKRFHDTVLAIKDDKITFHCTNPYLKKPKYMQLTPHPVIFLAKQNNSKKHSKNWDAMITISKGSCVRLDGVCFSGDNASCCMLNYGELSLSNCDFSNIMYSGLKSYGSLYVKDSKFEDINGYPILSYTRSYVEVENCEFHKVGLRGSNVACVYAGGDAYIANNDFLDFNYCAISLGSYNETDSAYLPASIAENNRIRWTRSWERKMRWYGLVDGGAIYVSTNNKRCIIRNNVILNFGGHGSNRGIYCDDGAYNVTIYGNVITGIKNSYAIDSWDCSKNPINSTPKGMIPNTNNYIGNNICSGYIRIIGASAIPRNNCCFENNVIVGVSDSNESVVKNNIPDKRAILYDRKAKITRLGKVRLKETKSVVGL